KAWGEGATAMIGRRTGGQKKLFYSFNLDDHVPTDHLLRGIDRVLDLGELRGHLAPFYSHTGRPSIDPELMMRMLIVGYSFGIRSERGPVRRGAPQSGLSLVLSTGSRGCSAGPFDVLE